MAEAKKTAPKAVKPEAQTKDVEDNKIYAAIGYIGILFLIPLLVAKDSAFAQFHAKQAINLFILSFIGSTVGSILPIIGWFIILPVVAIGSFVLAIIGIINAINGKMEKLPLIGEIQIVK